MYLLADNIFAFVAQVFVNGSYTSTLLEYVVSTHQIAYILLFIVQAVR